MKLTSSHLNLAYLITVLLYFLGSHVAGKFLFSGRSINRILEANEIV